ncbi:MAG: endonuclease/exonuclease/phosphatase family protein [Muriicola sp.]|nr:endonuclease/exonuclease/phosphatase family protein [Muriicola sp.]
MRLITISSSCLLVVFSIYISSIESQVVFLDLLLLFTPYLVGLNFILGFAYSLKRNKLLFFPLVALIVWIFVLAPFLVFSTDDEEKSPEDISLLSYNVMEFIGNYRDRPSDIQDKILDFVSEQEADIVCFQEFASTKLSRERLAIYPYNFVYSPRGNKRFAPLSIFSRYPIISSGSLDFENTLNNSIYVDVLIDADTLRIYNVHLQSMRVRPGSIKRENPVNLFSRLGKTIEQQKKQAVQILEHSGKVAHPVVFCGDFNNTQYSKVYRLLKEDKEDSFLERGNGLGNTLLFKFLPFRIDYVLVDDELEISGHQNFDIHLSDHTPIKATFRFQIP